MTQPANFEVDLVFDVTEEADGNQLAKLIEQRLSTLDIVKDIEAKATEQRITGVEVTAAIGVTVLILRGSRIIVHEMRLLLQEVKALILDIKGLKSATVKIGEKQVSTDDVDDKAIQDLLEEVKSIEDQ